MELDREGSVAWIVAQPFWLEMYEGGKRTLRHAPDFLRGVKGGGVVMENVRPLHRRVPTFFEKVKMCEMFAAITGWQYQTVGDFEGSTAEVLSYLWQYARVEPRVSVVERLLGAFRERTIWTLGELRSRCVQGLADYPTIMALVWRGELAIDMTQPISGWTQVRLGDRLRT